MTEISDYTLPKPDTQAVICQTLEMIALSFPEFKLWMFIYSNEESYD